MKRDMMLPPGSLVVSCQAGPGNPLQAPETMHPPSARRRDRGHAVLHHPRPYPRHVPADPPRTRRVLTGSRRHGHVDGTAGAG